MNVILPGTEHDKAAVHYSCQVPISSRDPSIPPFIDGTVHGPLSHPKHSEGGGFQTYLWTKHHVYGVLPEGPALLIPMFVVFLAWRVHEKFWNAFEPENWAELVDCCY